MHIDLLAIGVAALLGAALMWIFGKSSRDENRRREQYVGEYIDDYEIVWEAYDGRMLSSSHRCLYIKEGALWCDSKGGRAELIARPASAEEKALWHDFWSKILV